MKPTRLMQLLLVLAPSFTVLAPVSSFAADKAKEGKAMDDKMMMDKMVQAGTPGAAHQKLEPLAGKFTVKSKMWTDPSKAPQESTGTAERTWIFDKRYLEERFQGNYAGQPFNGIVTFDSPMTAKGVSTLDAKTFTN